MAEMRYLLIKSSMNEDPLGVWLEDDKKLFAHFGKPEWNLREQESAKSSGKKKLEDLIGRGYSYYTMEIGEYTGAKRVEIHSLIKKLRDNYAPRKTEAKAARFPLNQEPYDPDARDGDGDGIVQEGTAWERPAATRLMDAAGNLIERGREASSRPTGIRVVDENGNDVDYTPTYERAETGTIGAARQIGETPSVTRKPSEVKPIVEEKPQRPVPAKPTSGTPLADHGATSLKERGLISVRESAAPPPPPAPPKKPEPKKGSIEEARTGEPIIIVGMRQEGAQVETELTDEARDALGRDALFGPGLYFTDDEAYLPAAGKRQDLTVTLQNPYVLDLEEIDLDQYEDAEAMWADVDAALPNPEMLQRLGYDGIIARGGPIVGEDIRQAVVFPNAIDAAVKIEKPSKASAPKETPKVEDPAELPGVTAASTDRPELVEPTKPRSPYKPSPPPLSGRAQELADEADGDFKKFMELLDKEGYVVFDYETTGLQDGNIPVQIGAVRMKDGEIVERFNVFTNPRRPLSQWSKDNLKDKDGNPLTDEWLEGQTSLEEAHKQMAAFLGDSIIVAHNLPYDGEIIERMMKDADIDYKPSGSIDTLMLLRSAVPKGEGEDGPERHTLGALADFFGVDLGDAAHTADADSEAAALVLAKAMDWADQKKSDPEIFDATKQKELFDSATKKYNDQRKKYEADLDKYRSDMEEYQRSIAKADDVVSAPAPPQPEPAKPEPKKGSIDEARTGEPIVIVGMRQDGAQVETELTQEARDAIGRDALFGPGLYFTDDEAYLPAAGKRQDLTVTLQNPYVIDLEEIDPDQYEDMEGVWADVASALPNPELLQRLGHDGIIARGGPIVGEDIHQAVVFPEAVDAAVKIEKPAGQPSTPDKPEAPEGEYRMSHQPSDDGPRAFDLTEDGGGDWSMPGDVYDNPNLYTGADATVRKETMEQLERVRGNPDGLVTVYRYAPEGREFEVGNWVSLSQTYARQHGESNPTPGGTVQSMQVPAKEVRFAGDDLAEFGWYPESQDSKPEVPEGRQPARISGTFAEIFPKWEGEIPEIIKAQRAHETSNGYENLALREIQKRQGFDGLPEVIPSTEWQDFVDSNPDHIPIFRGIAPWGGDASASDLVEQFRSGPYFAGNGIFGAGTYTATDAEDARVYMGNQRGDTSTDGLIEMLIRPDARIIEWGDARDLNASDSDLDKHINDTDDESSWDLRDITNDTGRTAAMFGYDAILVKDKDSGEGDFYILLNRTAVAVKGAEGK